MSWGELKVESSAPESSEDTWHCVGTLALVVHGMAADCGRVLIHCGVAQALAEELDFQLSCNGMGLCKPPSAFSQMRNHNSPML